MKVLVFLVAVFALFFAGVGAVLALESIGHSAAADPQPMAAQVQQPVQSQSQPSYQVQQPQTSDPSDAPSSEAGWIALVSQRVNGYGSVLNLNRVQDGFGAVQVRLDANWILPSGWAAHTGDGDNLVGGQTIPGNMVSSIYPPCSWRANLGFQGC